MKRLIPLLLLFVSLPSLAQRQFDIEVIIFKRAVDAEKVNESWPNTQPKISLERVGSFQDTQYRAKERRSNAALLGIQVNASERQAT